MTDYTYNTGNPIGSTDVRDGVDNLKSFDVLLNSAADTYQDRLGNTVPTAAGAIKRLGPVVVSWTFTTGGTLNYPNEAALNPADGNYYGWTGVYPKVVAPGTDPTLPGSGYVPRTDVILRNNLPFVTADAYTGANDTAILQSAINDAVSKGVKHISFNRDYTVNDLVNRQEVVFIGSHKITGPGAYRLRVIDGTEADSVTGLGVFATTDLPKFASKSSPVVVFVGDSLTTYDPNSIDTQHSLFASMCRKIKADNPGKTITFYNRGIGGSVWYEINSVAVYGWPDWYTNHASPWLDYVSSLNPDLVIISAGMNDSDTININSVKSAITKVKAFPSSPDVLCMTTPVPSTAPGGSFDALFATKAAQEGRDYAAGVVRSTCASLGVPVIDINRQCNAIRDGFDILESYGELLDSPALSSGGFKSPIECRNWSATVSIVDEYPYTAQAPLAVKVGPSSTDVVFIKADVSGNIKLELYNKDESLYQTVVLAGQAIPSTSHDLRIEVYNNSIRVFIAGTSIDSLPKMTQLRVGGGLYFPGIGNSEDNFNSGFIAGISKFSYGVHKKLIPLVTNNELWGVGNGDALTKSPFGGNGINHPTSIGAIALYQDAFNQSDFSLNPSPSVFIGQHASGGYETVGGVVTRIWGRWMAPYLAARFDAHIDWPVTVTGTTLRFIASAGVNSEDLDGTAGMRNAQTIVCSGSPSAGGVDFTVFCLTEEGFGRIVDWELLVS